MNLILIKIGKNIKYKMDTELVAVCRACKAEGYQKFYLD